MPNPSMEILAWARIHDTTEIKYSVCAGGVVELTVGGLTIDTTQRGLENLLIAVNGALHALRSAPAA